MCHWLLAKLTVEKKDLGVYVNIGLKPSSQCAKSVNRAMSVLRMVTRKFQRTDRKKLKYTIRLN